MGGWESGRVSLRNSEFKIICVRYTDDKARVCSGLM